MFSGHRVEGKASQREVAKSGQTWRYGLGSMTMVSCNCPCSQELIWGVIFFFFLTQGLCQWSSEARDSVLSPVHTLGKHSLSYCWFLLYC